jgi:short-subunit dehydrogenase
MDRKVIVITGASSGIGAALALLLGSQGHQLVLAARRQKELTAVAKQAGKYAAPVVADVTRRADVLRLKETALSTFGRIDVWVNNAGQGIVRPVLELTDTDIDQMMRANVMSALYGMQVIVPYFQQQARGHVINVSSFLGKAPVVSVRSAYSAAKAALNVLTANLRMDLRASHPDIHVSLVIPGMVATDFSRSAIGADPEQTAGPVAGQKNVQTAEEVAAVIASVIETPKSETYTNPSSVTILQRYREDVDAFEIGLLKRSR